MRILPSVTPTPEQLTLLVESRPGVFVINGAAGSGKTTTALLRLTSLCGQWLSRKQRLGLDEPVRVLVLTYNRTLEGYISELARTQVAGNERLANAVAQNDLVLSVETFGKWAVGLVGAAASPDADACRALLETFAAPFGLPLRFVTDEVEYILGRFEPGKLEQYLTVIREGRGTTPRMDAAMRRRLLDDVVYPYVEEKVRRSLRDWNDLAVSAALEPAQTLDIVIVDEAQDFSANQVRAVMQHVAEPFSATFVMDAAQRIYPRSFTWREAGVSLTSSKRLGTNFRNTKQIAAFAASVLSGMAIGDDGTLPDFHHATVDGAKPHVLMGKFSAQFDWAVTNVVRSADLANESVVFLHPLGGRWFDYVKVGLNAAAIPWVQLTRASTWPGGDETVALSTIHSAKGLEFDHVILLGLNQQVTPHGDGREDTELEVLRRLLAMGIGRARKTVTLGFKPSEASTLIGLLAPETFEQVVI